MSQHSFDPSKHLTRVSGRDYLEVKWRLVWMRSEHPDAAIFTELVEHQDGRAVFKARAALAAGAEATGWGSKTADECEDYLEAAETKALGRALAALGYGTQFCEDFVQRNEDQERIPSPVPSRQIRSIDQARPEPMRPTASARRSGTRLTAAQLKAIYAIARQKYGWQEPATGSRCREHLGRPPEELTKQEASGFIDELKSGDVGAGRPSTGSG